MQFGQVENIQNIDFKLPEIPLETLEFLKRNSIDTPLEVRVGCAQWNKQELKGFYPRGTKDELTYYSTQFNAIELNSTFYNSPSAQQVETWKNKAAAGFKFFPKIPKSISHNHRLLNTNEIMKEFIDSTVLFDEKLGMSFLQMIESFHPKDIGRLETFLKSVPAYYPLAVEVRNTEWFKAPLSTAYFELLRATNKTNIIVDTAGRRDMVNLTLTSPYAFVRFVATNDLTCDYERLENWIEVINKWKEYGLQKLFFFVHQNMQLNTPMLATFLIERLNNTVSSSLRIPHKAADKRENNTVLTLF